MLQNLIFMMHMGILCQVEMSALALQCLRDGGPDFGSEGPPRVQSPLRSLRGGCTNPEPSGHGQPLEGTHDTLAEEMREMGGGRGTAVSSQSPSGLLRTADSSENPTVILGGPAIARAVSILEKLSLGMEVRYLCDSLPC